MFCSISHRFRDFKVSHFLPLKIGQGHRVQFSSCCLAENIKIYKTVTFKNCHETIRLLSKSTQIVPCIFALALTVSEILTLQMCLPFVGRGHRLQFSQWHHSMTNVEVLNVILTFLIYAKMWP